MDTIEEFEARIKGLVQRLVRQGRTNDAVNAIHDARRMLSDAGGPQRQIDSSTKEWSWTGDFELFKLKHRR